MERRTLLKWATNGLGGLFAAFLGIPGVSYLFDARNRPALAGAFKPVTRLSELTVDKPVKVIVRDIRRDAWTLHPNDVIGRVWIVRREGTNADGTPKIEAYSSVCPHLGGSINFENKSQCFVCPLHGATFDAACHRVDEQQLGRANPAPRDMDRLDVELKPILGADGDFVVRVKYENFVQGKEDRIPKT